MNMTDVRVWHTKEREYQTKKCEKHTKKVSDFWLKLKFILYKVYKNKKYTFYMPFFSYQKDKLK